MNSPRSGFRRAAIASWALAGLGAAGVAGTSVLAYGDTVKPVAAGEMAVLDQPAIPGTAELPTSAPVAPAPVAPAPVVQQAPTPTYTPSYTAPAPQYTQAPVQTYAPIQTSAPAQTYTPAPAVTPQGPIGGSSSSSSARSTSGKSSASSSSTRKVPMGSSGGPNKAVPHTVARGS